MANITTLYKEYLKPDNQSQLALLTLVAANLLPIYGVLFLGWNAFNIVLLYWAENLIIGFYNILKIAAVKCPLPAQHLSKLFAIPFFTVHFGGFCAVHGIFIFALFDKSAHNNIFPSQNSWPCILVFVQLLLRIISHGWATLTPYMKYTVIALFLSHGISYIYNFLIKGEYALQNTPKLMAEPYARIIVMHIAIIAGAFISQAIGSPAGVLLILILLKTAIDINLHLRQHKAKI